MTTRKKTYRRPTEDEISRMQSPARCTHCGGIYDLGMVTVYQRYSDCSVWKTPCCGRTADDRKFKSLPDYTEIDKARLRYPFIDAYGRTFGD